MVYFARHITCTLHVRESVSDYATDTDKAEAPETSASESPPASSSTRDPFDDADSLEELEEEITVLAAHIHAATHRLLVLIAEFDRRRGWELGGHRSCAHWLAFRTGFDMGAAREKVRTARALTELPETSTSMSRGELSFSAVRALTRVATPDNETDLLPMAQGCTTAQVERLVRGWKLGSKQDEEVRERERYESRTLSIFPDNEGMYVVRGRLTPEIGALLMRAVEAASDAIYQDRISKAAEKSVPAETLQGEHGREAARRRADALGLMAERAMAAGFGEGAPISGSSAERYQVMLHVDADTLASEGEMGRSELEDGTRVSAETSRRHTCDGAVVAVGHGPDGSVLSVGRRTR
ncbi:MAG: DUF222 domain-containing protein, partial [Gemmatimonadota bacterium]